LNYRLGPFGWFLDASNATDPDAANASGNFGTLDMIAALRWIKENIEAFGGDPGNVTVSGQSAGAFNVLCLLTAPSAHGLFQRAIVESNGNRMASREQALVASEDLLEAILIKTGQARDEAAAVALAATLAPEKRAAIFRSTSTQDIIALQKGAAPQETVLTPWPNQITDGNILPSDGFAGFARGDWANKVPLIIGSNKEELKFFLWSNKGLDWKTPLYVAAAKYGSKVWRAMGVDELADAMASSPGTPPVFVYRFDWGAPDSEGRSPEPGDYGKRLGAFHAVEISFFLGSETCVGPLLTNTLFTTENRPGREDLSRGIMAYLASFATTGNPNARAQGMPFWPPRPPAAATAVPGATLGLVFDATNDKASFTPLTELLTSRGVNDEIDKDLLPDFASQVREKFVVREQGLVINAK
jgi:para-nitrobenzyl esterase